MAVGTFQIEGQKFRVVPEEEYKQLRAAARMIEREAKLDAADLSEAMRRIVDPKAQVVSLARLKADLGL